MCRKSITVSTGDPREGWGRGFLVPFSSPGAVGELPLFCQMPRFPVLWAPLHLLPLETRGTGLSSRTRVALGSGGLLSHSVGTSVLPFWGFCSHLCFVSWPLCGVGGYQQGLCSK